MIDLVKIYNKLQNKPAGKWMFSKLVCRVVPYFGTIYPKVEFLSSEKCIVSMKKRKAVYNHINTIHAIAVCNLAEMAAGLLMVASTPLKGMRWLPKGMNVQYLKKCESTLTAEVNIQLDDLVVGDNILNVKVTDESGALVVIADINMYLTKVPLKK